MSSLRKALLTVSISGTLAGGFFFYEGFQVLEEDYNISINYERRKVLKEELQRSSGDLLSIFRYTFREQNLEDLTRRFSHHLELKREYDSLSSLEEIKEFETYNKGVTARSITKFFMGILCFVPLIFYLNNKKYKR